MVADEALPYSWIFTSSLSIINDMIWIWSISWMLIFMSFGCSSFFDVDLNNFIIVRFNDFNVAPNKKLTVTELFHLFVSS